MSSSSDPYEPPSAEIPMPEKQTQEVTPYWARRGLLEWHSDLGFRGKLAWAGGILLAANGIAYLFGFFGLECLMGAIALLFVSAVLSASEFI